MSAILDSVEAIRRIDRFCMLDHIAGLPQQFLEGYRAGWCLTLRPRVIEQVLFVGMGGSAVNGDLVKAWLTSSARLPISVQRTYDLPAWVSRRTLVFASSYSGDTEETLSAYVQARRRGASLVAVTSGGVLGRWVKRDGVPWGRVPLGLPPRAALGYLCATPLGMLARAGVADISERQLRVAALATARAMRAWGPAVPARRNLAKQLALSMQGRFVVVYGADGGWEAVVTRWRGQLAENAKALASSHLFPEMNHNEVNGWRFPSRLLRQSVAVFLMDPALHPRVWARMAITMRILRKVGARVIPVTVAGPTLLSRTLSAIALGDSLSVYLAVLNRADPTPVDRVVFLKRALSRIGARRPVEKVPGT